MRAERRGNAPSVWVAMALVVGLCAISCASARRTVTPGIRDRAHALEEASHETSLSGDLSRAAILEQRAVDAYRSIDDVEAVAGGLNRLGNLRQRAGDRTAARRAYLEAAELARASGSLAQEAAAENNLGTLSEDAGDAGAASARYTSALSLARESDAASVEAAALNNLGLLALAAGDLSGAKADFEAALEIDRSEEDRAGEATRWRNLGSMHRRAGDTAGAIEAYERAHQIDREREDVPAIALDLVAISEARAEAGLDLSRAVSERRRAQEIHRFLKDDGAVRHDGRRIATWCSELGAAAPPDCVPRDVGAMS